MKKLVAVALLLMICGCTVQQEEGVENAGVLLSKGAGVAAPFLPPPFNMLAIGLEAIGIGVAAWMAKRRGTRATDAELREKAEADAKDRLAGSIRSVSKLIDELRNDGKHGGKVNDFLKLLDEKKRGLDEWERKTVYLFDAVRKGLEMMPTGREYANGKEIKLPSVSL